MTATNTAKKPVTIRDLANILSIPISTVGNVLRGDPRYSDDLREQVTKLAKEMGYRRNVLASGLRGGKTNTVGILWSFGGFDVGSLISDLASECYARGYSTLLCESLSEISLIEERLSEFLVRQVDAVVFQWAYTFEVPPQLIQQLGRFESLVVVSPVPVNFPCRNIVLSVDAGLMAAAETLIASGRSRPAVLASIQSNMHKVNAFFKPFIDHGLIGDSPPVYDVGKSGAMGSRIYYDRLSTSFRHRKFNHDCLFCGVDEGAIAAIRWLNERGHKVPEDVAVLGFNDSQFCRMTQPTITSVGRPAKRVVEEITDVLFSEEESKVSEIRIDYELILRESTGMIENKS